MAAAPNGCETESNAFSRYLSGTFGVSDSHDHNHECLHDVRMVGIQPMDTCVPLTPDGAGRSWFDHLCYVGAGDRNAGRHVVRICDIRLHE